MRKMVLVGAGLSILAMGGVAVAQTPPAPGGPPPAAADNAGPGRPDARGPMEMGRGPMEMGGRFGGPRRFMEMMRMQMSQAARFHLRRGDAVIDIRCAANEPTQACVNAAGTLLDKLGQQRSAGQ